MTPVFEDITQSPTSRRQLLTLAVVGGACLFTAKAAAPAEAATTAVAGGHRPTDPARITGLGSRYASDIFGAHDAIPRGVPRGYSWRNGADTNPNKAFLGFESYAAMNVWGQCFVPTSGSANYHVRLQARDPRIYFFNGTRWTRATLNAGAMGGAYYTGDFRSSSNSTRTSHGSTTYSTSLQPLASGTRDAFHWWWDGMFPRIVIPVGTQGILVRTSMRLIPDSGYHGVAGARFIATACADLFSTRHTTVAPGGMNPGIPEGRMKWVTGEWQDFYDATVTLQTLKSHTPHIKD